MDSEERSDTGPAADRYRVHETEDGRLVVYDEENGDAWVRSDLAVEPCR